MQQPGGSDGEGDTDGEEDGGDVVRDGAGEVAVMVVKMMILNIYQTPNTKLECKN